MPRLLSSSKAFGGIVEWTLVSGPNSRNSGSTTAMDGSEQTFAAYGDAVALELTLSRKEGREARDLSGLIMAASHGNALKLAFFDPDMISPAESGLSVEAQSTWFSGELSQPWSGGSTWSNGRGWRRRAPLVPVIASSAMDTGVVYLSDANWGHTLGHGSWIGFAPFHFGMYMVTEVIAPGTYRIWPRLRRAIDVTNWATLFPTVAMRPVMGTRPPRRGPGLTDEVTVTLVEVQDYYVRDYYTG